MSGRLLARIIHDGSLRNRAVVRQDGRVEPRGATSDVTQPVEAARGEPAREPAEHDE